MNAPWLEFPDYKPGSLGFRMGAGEDYMIKFRHYWSSLKHEQKQRFILDNRPDRDWQTFLHGT